MEPFARTIDAAKKYIVSSTLDRVDWNAQLVRGDLGKAVQQFKCESGKGLFTGGVQLPLRCPRFRSIGSGITFDLPTSIPVAFATSAQPIDRIRSRRQSQPILWPGLSKTNLVPR
jgi:hypothetical protein